MKERNVMMLVMLLGWHLCGVQNSQYDHCTDQSPNFSTFKEPKKRFPGTNSARLCSLAGGYDNFFSTRFLAPIDCLKIPAQCSFRPPIIYSLYFFCTLNVQCTYFTSIINCYSYFSAVPHWNILWAYMYVLRIPSNRSYTTMEFSVSL